jgi:hypothetical protein
MQRLKLTRNQFSNREDLLKNENKIKLDRLMMQGILTVYEGECIIKWSRYTTKWTKVIILIGIVPLI